MENRKILIEITKEELEKFEKFDSGLSAFSTNELIKEIVKRTEANNKQCISSSGPMSVRPLNIIHGSIKIENKDKFKADSEFEYTLRSYE